MAQMALNAVGAGIRGGHELDLVLYAGDETSNWVNAWIIALAQLECPPL